MRVRFGQIFCVDDDVLTIHAGHTLNQVHFATHLPLAELQNMVHVDPTQPFERDVVLKVGAVRAQKIQKYVTQTLHSLPTPRHYEETFSGSKQRVWQKRVGSYLPYYGEFLVDKNNAQLVVVKIKFFLQGALEDTARIRKIEDFIEKALALPGFVVDVEFVDRPGQGINTILVDPNASPHATVWNPNQQSSEEIAHEIGHHLGLPDEYPPKMMDETNFDGTPLYPDIPWIVRKMIRLTSPFRHIPKDADRSKMGPDHHQNLLPRHVAKITGIANWKPAANYPVILDVEKK